MKPFRFSVPYPVYGNLEVFTVTPDLVVPIYLNCVTPVHRGVDCFDSLTWAKFEAHSQSLPVLGALSMKGLIRLIGLVY